MIVGRLGWSVSLAIEPNRLLMAHLAGVAARNRGVEADQPEFVILDHEVDRVERAARRQPSESTAHLGAIVVVAGYRHQRRPKLTEEFHQMFVLSGSAVVDEIARSDHQIGLRVERIDQRNRLS